MSESLRGRRLEEMTQLNTSSPRGSEVLVRVPERVMAIKVPLNEEVSGGSKNGGRKGVDSAIRQRRANKGSINIKE